MIAPGTVLGRYTVRQPLGAGGMGEIYVAFDPELERAVALKVLPSDLASDADRLARFVREAKAASALNHPNILTVFDAGTHDQTRFLVTELVDGRTLREWSAEARPPLAELLDAIAQAASALAAAHEAGIVHRDIKPENLMLRRDGFVKVLDFGIAKLLAEAPPAPDGGASTDPQFRTQPGQILGTTRYMSPEQALGAAVDARSDVWSLGVVLYELLAGKPPFQGPTPMGTLAMIMGREPEPLERAAPGTPDAVCRVVERALRKQPAERPASAELASELRRVARELESGAAPESEARTATLAPAVAVVVEAPPTNLPAALSPIVGREREIEEVAGLLRAPAVRLVTLTGPGGTGKTRLALEVARALVAEYRDGVFAVDLSQLSEPGLVAAHVGHALGVREAGSAPMSELLSRHLRDRELLLVVDSFEHLLSAAPLVSELLSAAPALKVLATSREPLHLRHEREVAVEPLEVPVFGSLPPLDELERTGAVALFLERAQAARPWFALTAENARAVVEICRRLDGLPLALELAAARVKLLSPQAMLERFDQRLKLLTGGARDLPARQQTMRGAIAWSYDLLDDGERELLCRLAVFSGGWTLGAAEAVCGSAGLDVLDGIASLVDKSLLRQRGEEDGESRFRMLDLVREFALEQLEANGWGDEARGEHARYFLRLAEEAGPELRGAEQAVWLERVGREHDNLRAALSLLLERSPEEGVRLASALQRYWHIRSHYTEGLSWIERALETGAAAPSVRVRLLADAANMRWSLGDLEGAAFHARASLALARELGDQMAAALALNTLGLIAADDSRFEEARAHFEEVLALARAHDSKGFLTMALVNLGWVASQEKDYAASVRYFEQALDVAGRDRCTQRVANAFWNLGEVRFKLGEVEAARACYREALAKARQLGNAFTCAMCLDGFAAVAVEDGRLEAAAALAGAVEGQYEVLGVSLPPTSSAFRARYVEKLKAALEPAALERAWARGRAMGLEAAVAEALRSG
jgi:non-specific serine/threonine protein kinase